MTGPPFPLPREGGRVVAETGSYEHRRKSPSAKASSDADEKNHLPLVRLDEALRNRSACRSPHCRLLVTDAYQRDPLPRRQYKCSKALPFCIIVSLRKCAQRVASTAKQASSLFSPFLSFFLSERVRPQNVTRTKAKNAQTCEACTTLLATNRCAVPVLGRRVVRHCDVT